MATVYRCVEHEMLDHMCFRHYGQSERATEMVLEANPHLADVGPHLPVGLQIILPDIPEDQLKPEVKRKIKVFA